MRARKTGSQRRREAIETKEPRPTPAVASRRLPIPARAMGRLPLVAALVPDPDVWRVAGAGRALVARRRADGRIAWASLAFDLKRPDDLQLFGNLESDEGAFEEILDALFRIEDAPPMVGGSDSLAARFVHGALAYARNGEAKPVDAPDLLSVFDRPGSTEQLLESFAGPEGVCPPDLVAACREEAEAGLPVGQALAVHVALGFVVDGGTDLAKALAKDSDFEPAGKSAFAWKPAAFGRQRLGSIALVDDEVEAETVSLDLAGRLCGRLKRLAEGGLELVRLARRPLD